MGLDIYSGDYTNDPTVPFKKSKYTTSPIYFGETRSPIKFIENISEINSDLYPDHMCNKNYLRSSYNENGYDRVASRLNCIDLYSIFDPVFVNIDQDERIILSQENLILCKANAIRNKNLWLALDDKEFDYFLVYDIFDKNYKSEIEAFELFKKIESERSDKIFMDFENRDGYFSLDGFEIYGILKNVVPDIFSHIKSEDKAGTMIVYKRDIVYYKQMSEIIIEFIDFLLQSKDPYIYFSG